jgi:hypothetical protein
VDGTMSGWWAAWELWYRECRTVKMVGRHRGLWLDGGLPAYVEVILDYTHTFLPSLVKISKEAGRYVR